MVSKKLMYLSMGGVKIFLSVLAAGAVLVLAALTDDSPLVIQSQESKTAEGKAIFNQIRYQPGAERDVWLMRQNHHGHSDPEHSEEGEWDRLAIVVSHSDSGAPPQAQFFQLAPGTLTYSGEEPVIRNRVQCFMCHANGPRAIRPDVGKEAQVSLSVWNRWRIFLWNVRIKSYGPVATASQNHDPTFRYQSPVANEPLAVAVCRSCHNGESWFGRAPLVKQQFSTIRFMVENGHMPPPFVPFSDEDRTEVMKFVGAL